MSTSFSPLWTDRSSDMRLTGTWRSAIPVYETLPSPCLGACPVDGQIADWMLKLAEGDIFAAWLTLVENNPFPAVIGRICHHPCQTACNRQNLDEAVGIASLERFVGDHALAEGWEFPRPPPADKGHVAVVGGGPAGLAAAYHLRRAGYRVTIFEAGAVLGGLLQSGIPSYRLEKPVLEAEITRLLALGIEVRLNSGILSGNALNELHRAFDAVYLATGAAKPKALPGLDYGQPYVIDSAEFLAATNSGETVETGPHILVIGGGSAAMDVARSARRLGRKVTVLSLEPEGQLPAQMAEVVEAQEEGVRFVAGAMLQSVGAANGALLLGCVKVDFRPGAARGEFSATPIAGSNFTLTADTIIPAIGQDADLTAFDGQIEAEGVLARTGPDWQTATPGIFAGGDLVSMDRFVSAALGMGKQAAGAVARYIEGGTPPSAIPAPLVPYQVINTAYHPKTPRRLQDAVPPAKRLSGFAEVQLPLAQATARAEAARCFSCGTCIFCDNCFFYCPDMAILKREGGYDVLSDYCKGCGLCVAECPTGSIRMIADAGGAA